MFANRLRRGFAPGSTRNLGVLCLAFLGTGPCGGSTPRLTLARSIAVPWIGGPAVHARLELDAGPPGGAWKMSVTVVVRDAEESRPIIRRTVTADDRGRCSLETVLAFAAPGWYEIRGSADSPGGRFEIAVQQPVTRRRVDFAWYQAENGRELRWPTIQLTAGKPEEQAYWRRRGVLPARWCGAACGKNKPVEYFAKKWSSFPAIAIDEFGGGAEACAKFARALVEARKRRPHTFIAVWFCGGYDYWPELRDTIDLFLPEVYLNFTQYNLSRFDKIVALGRRTGVFAKMLPGLGINVVKNKDGSIRYRPAVDELVAEVRYLKQIAPDLRGLAFFTYGSAEPAVRAAMDRACRDYFLRPVADILGATCRPEVAPPGVPGIVAVRLRNAGGMPARGVVLEVLDADRVAARTAVTLRSGEEQSVSIPVRIATGARELVVRTVPREGLTLLRSDVRVPVARVPDSAPVVYVPPLEVPAPAALPIEVANAERAAAAELLDRHGRDSGSLPVCRLRPLAGAELLCWPDIERPVGTASFVRLRRRDRTASPLEAVKWQRRNDGRIEVRTRTYRAVLAPNRDALLSVNPGVRGTNLFRSPWRMNWSVWKGFQAPRIRGDALAVEVRVPVRNATLSGTSRYVFHPSCIEIERAFSSRKPLTVRYAAEGAELPQHEGAFRLQFGVGARPRRGRLEIRSTYQDLYFGSPGLDPEDAETGGWFDFSWDAAPRAGLGVAVARQWERRDSRVHYDVTRWYDAADRIEIIQVWNTDVTVGKGRSRVFLLPHAGLDMGDAKTVSPARALWERLRRPARLLDAK
ncbi:MAG: hypothetical protein GXP31_01270 [Kiritimatiellaeota bacterium]|nr:hypothetical protein [Kiritimatiellota bacterium]